MVQFLLNANPNTASIMSKKQKLALHFAAGEGHLAVAQALLQCHPVGAQVASAKGKIALHFAARWGHVEIANLLMHYYPDGVRALDWEGSLPLHDAAREGQVAMAQYLVELFPTGLATTNLRGELPLFAAVRSGNVNLIVWFIQAWPASGKHVLQSVSADDMIDWSWTTLEWLLRGAVQQLEAQASMPPKLPHDMNVVAMAPQPDIPKAKRLLMEPTLVSPATVDAATSRSKSPILQDDDPQGKKRSRKRQRLSKRFIPLHAALECGASVPVLQHILRQRSNDLQEIDDYGRNVLHWAVTECRENDHVKVEFVLALIGRTLDACRVRDHQQRLPLHLAVAAQADVRVIEALLDAVPESGFEPCGTLDEWKNLTPLYMACYYDCDVSTVYRFLRVDPSVLKDEKHAV